ncbi:NAD(P)-dependent oxidoreductase [Psychrobacter lutiphocae]|uniref:NAD(P)-dependent oxidoreductase n=1 Tax=Psychrobacter lutiphocae TaxID=540500 RepID=UPI000377CF9C|nr:NAD(P)-dependent oxidoreductase [Psychrobacter lutiphocae]
MKAVLLDKKRFADNIELPQPEKLSEYLVYHSTPQDNQVIIERCQDADIIIVGTLMIEREVIEALPNLKLIQVTSVGSNQIDKEACKAHGVDVFNVPGFASISVAEHGFMLLLNAMRAGIHYHQAALDGTWYQTGQAYFMDEPLIDLENLTLGIIGVGAIGKRMGELASAFGMNVLWAEHKGRSPRSDDYTDFDTVLSTSDVISLHCPLTEDTYHLIDKDAIAKMTKKPLLVNVARGQVVDTKALATAINDELVLGYATDVFEQEPAGENDPIIQLAKQHHPRVILSPHHGAGSDAAQIKLWRILSQQVNEFVTKHA